MRIRTLVPALACLAAAPLACGADSVPAIKFDGFVDTIMTATNVDHDGASTGFTYAGKLGVAATISEKVSAQVDLNIDEAGVLTSRQAYGAWKITNDIELKTGKFISDYGWTAAYAPGLYRINGGPIGQFYGVDQVGANAKYTKGDITAAVTVANGFFGEADGTSSQPAPVNAEQDNEAYAFGLDVVYSLGDMGSVNVEAIVDEDASATGEDADGYHFGLNATLTPVKDLTIGAELILQTINNKRQQDTTHTGVTVLANYKLSGTPFPMSITGQASMVDLDGFVNDPTDLESPANGASKIQSEFALALLTNPAGTDKLGANLEVSYTTTDTKGYNIAVPNDEDTAYEIGIAAEILYVF
jgi:hypothetical protein